MTALEKRKQVLERLKSSNLYSTNNKKMLQKIKNFLANMAICTLYDNANLTYNIDIMTPQFDLTGKESTLVRFEDVDDEHNFHYNIKITPHIDDILYYNIEFSESDLSLLFTITEYDDNLSIPNLEIQYYNSIGGMGMLTPVKLLQPFVDSDNEIDKDIIEGVSHVLCALRDMYLKFYKDESYTIRRPEK